MKKLFKYFMFVILCFCLVLPFAGCSEKKYGGIVSKVEEYKLETSSNEYLKITFNQNSDIECYVFFGLRIYNDDFENYGCDTLNSLLQDENFLNSDKSERIVLLDPKLGICITAKGLYYHSSYLLIYDGCDFREIKDMEDEEFDAYEEALFNNLDYSSYIGWIKF